mmetsp:Transcript_6293/g.10451  ORF Transcript_6293/g.10451 Transcript_6293/m.10451 type:complete len:228 (-) Transcript_6293:79-762(-)
MGLPSSSMMKSFVSLSNASGIQSGPSKLLFRHEIFLISAKFPSPWGRLVSKFESTLNVCKLDTFPNVSGRRLSLFSLRFSSRKFGAKAVDFSFDSPGIPKSMIKFDERSISSSLFNDHSSTGTAAMRFPDSISFCIRSRYEIEGGMDTIRLKDTSSAFTFLRTLISSSSFSIMFSLRLITRSFSPIRYSLLGILFNLRPTRFTEPVFSPLFNLALLLSVLEHTPPMM